MYQESNMEDPELIQLSGFDSVVLGSSRSCLRTNLVECPRELCTLPCGGGKSCVMAHKIRRIRGKKGSAKGFSCLCSLNLCIFLLFPEVEVWCL